MEKRNRTYQLRKFDSSRFGPDSYGFQGKCSYSQYCDESPAVYMIKVGKNRWIALCEKHAKRYKNNGKRTS